MLEDMKWCGVIEESYNPWSSTKYFIVIQRH
jgi:hypothetical protein